MYIGSKLGNLEMPHIIMSKTVDCKIVPVKGRGRTNVRLKDGKGGQAND